METAKNLDRFIAAQEQQYEIALSEIKAGQKRSHWMWYIFPQLRGLGHSSTAVYYGILDLEEAIAYLQHPILGARLTEITKVLRNLPGDDAHAIFGKPDDMKLRSCMTLFAQIPNAPTVFQDVLLKYFKGLPDEKTLSLLGI